MWAIETGLDLAAEPDVPGFVAVKEQEGGRTRRSNWGASSEIICTKA